MNGNNYQHDSRPYECKTCGEQFPINRLERHIKEGHFGSDGGIMVLSC